MSEWLKKVPAVFHIRPSCFQAYLLYSSVPTTRWSKHCIMLLPVLPFDKINDSKYMNLLYVLLICLNQKHNLSFTPHPHKLKKWVVLSFFPVCTFFLLFYILIHIIKLFCWRENFYKSKLHFFPKWTCITLSLLKGKLHATEEVK